MPEPIILYPSKLKIIGLILLGILMTIASGFAFKIGGVMGFLAGVVGMPFFALCTIFALVKLFSNKPSLIIDAKGITDNSTAIKAGFISWENIEKVFLWEMLDQTYIVILPRNLEEFMEKINPMKRRLMEANVKLTNGPIGIPDSLLPIPAQEAVSLMQNYLNQINRSAVVASAQTATTTQFQAQVEPLKRWNWGAFFLSWIWGISNGVWISLLTFVPVIGTIMPIILGLKGNEWAWKAKDWESIEKFEATQKRWAKAGFIVFGVLGALFIFALALIMLVESK